MARNLSINGANGFVFVEVGASASCAKEAEGACIIVGGPLPVADRDAGMQQECTTSDFALPASGANTPATVDVKPCPDALDSPTVPDSDELTLLPKDCPKPEVETVNTEPTLHDEVDPEWGLTPTQAWAVKAFLERSLGCVKRERDQVSRSAGELFTAFRGLEQLNGQVQAGHQALHTRYHRLHAEHTTLQRRCEGLKAKNAGLRRQCGEQRVQYSQLQQQFREQQGRIDALQKREGVLGGYCAQLEGQVELQGEEVQRLWGELEQRDEQLVQLQQQHDQQLEQLQQQHDEQLVQRQQQHNQQVGGLQEQLAQVQQQLAAATGTATTSGGGVTNNNSSDAAPPASATPTDPPTWAKVALSAAAVLCLPVVVPTVGVVAFCCTASRAINQAKPYASKGWLW